MNRQSKRQAIVKAKSIDSSESKEPIMWLLGSVPLFIFALISYKLMLQMF